MFGSWTFCVDIKSMVPRKEEVESEEKDLFLPPVSIRQYCTSSPSERTRSASMRQLDISWIRSTESDALEKRINGRQFVMMASLSSAFGVP